MPPGGLALLHVRWTGSDPIHLWLQGLNDDYETVKLAELVPVPGEGAMTMVLSTDDFVPRTATATKHPAAIPNSEHQLGSQAPAWLPLYASFRNDRWRVCRRTPPKTQQPQQVLGQTTACNERWPPRPSGSSTNHETDRGSPEVEVALVETIDEVAAECPQIAKVAAHTDVVVEESHGAKAKVPSPIVARR